ncbi:MAG: iron ABC transporter permease [Candidatus Diapherotrites archaeon]|nr:iron ABC transporter permease [Candidatus Diapherotrites archaeon]
MGKNILVKAIAFPAVLFAAVFFVYPVLLVFLQAFSEPLPVVLTRVFENHRLFENAFFQALVSTLAAFLIGFPAAYAVANFDFRGKKILKAVSLVPFVVPSILVALSFVIILGYNGVVNRILMAALGSSEPPIRILYGFWGIILAHAFYNFPVFMRIVSGAWERLPGRFEDAAKTLGATPRQVFFRVTIPGLLPSILASAVLVFIYCFTSFSIVLTLGGVRYSNVETGIFYALTRNLDIGLVAGLALAQFVVLVFGVVVSEWFAKKTFFQAREFEEKKKKPRISTVQGAVVYLVVCLVGLSIAAPFLGLAFFSVAQPTGFSFEAFGEIFFSKKTGLTGATPLSGIFNSLLFASTATIASTFIGLSLAIYGKEKKTGFLGTLATGVLAVSGVTLGTGYLLGFGTGNWLLVPAAHAVISLPFSFKIISNALRRLPDETIFAARTLGAAFWPVIAKIEIPAIRNAIIASAGFSFAISLGELGLALLLTEGKFPTMPVYIYRFISTYNVPGAAAMGIVLIVFSALCFYAIEKTEPKTNLV